MPLTTEDRVADLERRMEAVENGVRYSSSIPAPDPADIPSSNVHTTPSPQPQTDAPYIRLDAESPNKGVEVLSGPNPRVEVIPTPETVPDIKEPETEPDKKDAPASFDIKGPEAIAIAPEPVKVTPTKDEKSSDKKDTK